ncbi:hypothetical protein PACTADRAFT_34647 [Pachysolen tannophilus NRRL Y-2460]|uniref:Transcriptional regulatory protein SDS3 n=1 Tax=Pachysolen tannophilus NRRL Y-2460 TaxID=669874 RepID=A0A1E4TT31_PACTA|nr:hypothetical protein PACTADRAFT_34647 [Pachysolen tannophilus NRRL Y-2460]
MIINGEHGAPNTNNINHSMPQLPMIHQAQVQAQAQHQQALAQFHHQQQQAQAQAQAAAAVQVQAQAPAPVPIPTQNQTAVKRDKRRHTIANKLKKLDEKFLEEKDLYYRSNLHDLQMTLSTLHSNSNPLYLTKIQDYRELRDAELTRLRIAEEYDVFTTMNIFKEEYAKNKENYNNLIKQVKQKIYEVISNKISKLQEDKALMEVASSVTSTSGNINYSNNMTLHGTNNGGSSANSGYVSRSRRREDSQRKRVANGDTDYESTGYDSAGGGTSSRNNGSHYRHSNYNSSGNNNSNTNNGSNNKRQKVATATEDDLEQATMDELDELLYGTGSETPGQHSTRSTTTSGARHSSSHNHHTKKSKTPGDGLKSLDENEISEDLKIIKKIG